MLNKRFNKLKYRIQRFKNGYADIDVDNINYWFTSIIPDMILSLKTKQGNSPQDVSADEWAEFLEAMADSFKEYNPDTCSQVNEFRDTWLKLIKEEISTKHYQYTDEDLEIRNNFINREIEIKNHRKRMVNQGLNLFSKYFNNLWNKKN